MKISTHEEGDMWREEKKCIYFLFFLYFSILLQAEIFTPARKFRSLNHLWGKWRTTRNLWNEDSEYKWGRTDWGVDQDLLASLEGKEPHIHCTRCVLNKLYIMFTREKSDCFVIIFQGGLHLLYEIFLAIQQSLFSGMISGWTLLNLVRSQFLIVILTAEKNSSTSSPSSKVIFITCHKLLWL